MGSWAGVSGSLQPELLNRGPRGRIQGVYGLEWKKEVLFFFHCSPAEIEHFLHLWIFLTSPGVTAESMTLSPGEMTGAFKPHDSWDR